jgi:hypothetical protein
MTVGGHQVIIGALIDTGPGGHGRAVRRYEYWSGRPECGCDTRSKPMLWPASMSVILGFRNGPEISVLRREGLWAPYWLERLYISTNILGSYKISAKGLTNSQWFDISALCFIFYLFLWLKSMLTVWTARRPRKSVGHSIVDVKRKWN